MWKEKGSREAKKQIFLQSKIPQAFSPAPSVHVWTQIKASTFSVDNQSRAHPLAWKKKKNSATQSLYTRFISFIHTPNLGEIIIDTNCYIVEDLQNSGLISY